MRARGLNGRDERRAEIELVKVEEHIGIHHAQGRQLERLGRQQAPACRRGRGARVTDRGAEVDQREPRSLHASGEPRHLAALVEDERAFQVARADARLVNDRVPHVAASGQTSAEIELRRCGKRHPERRTRGAERRSCSLEGAPESLEMQRILHRADKGELCFAHQRIHAQRLRAPVGAGALKQQHTVGLRVYPQRSFL